MSTNKSVVWEGPTCQRMLLFSLEHEVAKVCVLDLLGLGTAVIKISVGCK